MKLVNCLACNSIFNLTYVEKSCTCGAVKGRYVDNSRAEVSGDHMAIAIGNGSYHNAMRAALPQSPPAEGVAEDTLVLRELVADGWDWLVEKTRIRVKTESAAAPQQMTTQGKAVTDLALELGGYAEPDTHDYQLSKEPLYIFTASELIAFARRITGSQV